MVNYIVRRLMIMPLLIFGVTLLIFAMLQFLSPVERAALFVRDIPKTDKAIDAFIIKYGLDDPLPVQYWHWLVGRKDPSSGEITGGILRGDFGYSKTANLEVIDMIKRRFPATLELALWAVAPIVLGGVWLGVLSAVNHNNAIDQVTRVFSILGYSFPTFVFGLLVLMIFYVGTGWFPPGRLSNEMNVVVLGDAFHRYTTMNTVDSLLNFRLDVFIDAARHLILPVLTLSYLNWALLLRVTRSSMLESLRQDYVTTARAKGLAEHDVIGRHARPNALIPVATIAGLLILLLLNGVVITETVFNYPGMGKAAADAAVQLDVITVLGLVLFNGIILVLSNLIVDITYAFLDPRIRLD
ncbi:MAG TPA: ABC transporter permease [Anaerolineales bacterium]|nr:ABC transporter permease [Anaerolineales bacterium]